MNVNPRDLCLTKERKRLEKNIVQSLINNTEILGAFIGGSVGNGSDDLYSDIDLRMAITQKRIQSISEQKIELAKKWGDILFVESAEYSRLLVVHYTNFIKLDLFLYTPEMIKASIWFKDIRIIKDFANGYLQNVSDQSKEMKFVYTSQDYLNFLLMCMKRTAAQDEKNIIMHYTISMHCASY